MKVNMNDIVGKMNILFITLDTLRYDAAKEVFDKGRCKNFRKLFPSGWQHCHSPGSFTYAAHHAFFAGFLPTPATPGRHTRLFAARFQGSETTGPDTCVLNADNIVTGLKELGYRTVCIGGTGFFNKKTPLGNVLPRMFEESYWNESFGVTDPCSTENQFRFAATRIATFRPEEKFFLFINVSAIHQPNYFYHDNSKQDTLESHVAALEYVDLQLPLLCKALQKLGNTFGIVCSDHGTAYGEDGFFGHRVGHAVVWDVPMATFILNKELNEPEK